MDRRGAARQPLLLDVGDRIRSGRLAIMRITTVLGREHRGVCMPLLEMPAARVAAIFRSPVVDESVSMNEPVHLVIRGHLPPRINALLRSHWSHRGRLQ